MQPTHEDNAFAVPGGELVRPQTVAQCHEVIDALMGLVAQTQRLVAEQQGQIAWLQERVKLDSRTSSKPPSLKSILGTTHWHTRRSISSSDQFASATK